MFNRVQLIVTFLLFTQLASSHSQNFIFDFNGVLMGTNTIASLKKIGLGTVIKCMIYLKKNPIDINTHIKTKLFEVLNNVAQVHAFDINVSQPAYDETGKLLPYLMRAWLDGSMTCARIKQYTHVAITAHPEWFAHEIEKKAICNIIQTIFTPQQFVDTRIIHQDCIAFIKACKKRGHKIYALSNWDRESFALLQEKHPDVFNLFDGIIISGNIHALKPSPEIYASLLNRYNLTPETCWFIDDQQENVTAASRLGIHGIMCHQTGIIKKPNFRLVARTIKDAVILQRHDEICETTVEAIPL